MSYLKVLLATAAALLAVHFFSHAPDLLRGTYDLAELRNDWFDHVPIVFAGLFGAYAHWHSETQASPPPAPAGWLGRVPRFVRYLLYLVVCLLLVPVLFSLTATLLEHGFGFTGNASSEVAGTVGRLGMLMVALYLFVVYEWRFTGEATPGQ